MKKVMIYAYTRFNLGDDLIIKILIERYPNTKFVLYAPDRYKNVFKKNRNIKLYSSNSLFSKVLTTGFRLIGVRDIYQRYISRKCDGAVYIGGSIFMQQDKWKIAYNRKQKMKIKGKPFFVLGANFGPFVDNEFYEAYKIGRAHV